MANRLPLPPELMTLIEKREDTKRRTADRRTTDATTAESAIDVLQSTTGKTEKRKTTTNRRKSKDRRGSSDK